MPRSTAVPRPTARTLDELPTPALVLDLDKLEANLSRMAERASGLGVSLRPHLKTHKCVEVGRRQRELGCRGVTVSTLYEARVFADAGFDDVTWAFPVIHSRIDEAAELASRIRLGLVVDSIDSVQALESSGHSFHVWLKVDCGYHRAGVRPAEAESTALARRLANSVSLEFAGILTHSGQAYHSTTSEDLLTAAEEERGVMALFADSLREAGIEVPCVSVGSTPAMSRVEDLSGIDEARPGNYAFYDFTQVCLGSCTVGDCALTVLTSVVSSPAGSGHSVVDAGALTLSRDPGPAHHEPPTMGEVFADYESGKLDRTCRIASVSQEHGILSCRAPVGTRFRVLPNHSCLTAACFDEYQVVRSETVVDRWKIWRGR